MKLYLSATSPYSRLCVIAAHLKGLHHLELQFVLPWENPEALLAVNPYSQIPALQLDDGTVMTETLIIMNHLDNKVLVQPDPKIGFGLATINQVVKAYTLELHRDKNYPPHPHHARAEEALQRALPFAPKFNPESASWGDVILGSALNYVTMRLPHLNFAISDENHQNIQIFNQQEFMVKTTAEALQKFPKTIGEL